MDNISNSKTVSRQPIFERKIDTLTTLIDALYQHIQRQKASHGDINLERCQYILDLYEGNDRKDKVSFSSQYYTRHAVHMPNNVKEFDIYIIGRDAHQMSQIHDHASNGCIIKFLDGRITEKRYSKTSTGFQLQTQTYFNKGDSSYISDSIAYHALGSDTNQRAVSIHVYSPAKWKTNYFKGKTGIGHKDIHKENSRLQDFFAWYNTGFRAEFVPGYIQYIPVKIYGFFQGIRLGSLLWFTGVNPGFSLGGLFPESKRSILQHFPEKYVPKTCVLTDVLKHDNLMMYIDTQIEQTGLSFPLIIKPDKGYRGIGVEIFHTKEERENKGRAYIESYASRGTLLLQEYVNYPYEIGAFYVRIPGEKQGTITNLSEKQFPYFEGDGIHTVKELVEEHERGQYHLDSLSVTYADIRDTILEDGKQLPISEIGTHSRGSTFVDISKQITPKLNNIFDTIAKNLDGFWYGRFDIRAKSMEHIYAGDFKIIELNETYGEPVGMYDPGYSLVKLRSILLKHRKMAYQIAKKKS